MDDPKALRPLQPEPARLVAGRGRGVFGGRGGVVLPLTPPTALAWRRRSTHCASGGQRAGDRGWYIAAGWTLLGLAAVGVWRYGYARWRLLIVAAVGWLFSLGPEMRIAGVQTGIPMPYALLQQLPLLEAGAAPTSSP